MPIFEYRCKKCGTTFEKLTLGGESGPVACTSCSGTDVEKLFSRFAAGSSHSSAPSCGMGPGPQCGGHTCCPGCKH